MHVRTNFVAATLATFLIGAAQPLAAAPATQAEATRLEAEFARYLGRPGPGEPPVAAVVPQGEGYLVSIDIERLARPLAALGLEFRAGTFRLNTSPADDGLWRVTDMAPPDMTLRYAGQTTRLHIDRIDGALLYDPALLSVRDGDITYFGLASTSEGPGTSSRRVTDRIVFKQTSRVEGPGIMSSQATVETTGERQTVTMVAPGGGPFEIETEVPHTSGDIRMDGFRSRAFMELWAYLVEKGSPAAITADQAGLKRRLLDVLPVFGSMEANGRAEGFTLSTPVGKATIAAIEGGVRSTGLDRKTSMTTVLTLSDLSLASPMLPSWAETLVPQSLRLDATMDGMDVDTAARRAIEAFDLARSPAIDPMVGKEISLAMFPQGVHVTVRPTRITAKVGWIDAEGDARLALDGTDYRFTVRANGLEDMIEALRAAKGATGTGWAQTALYGAKALAKLDPDGTYTWVIEDGPDGRPVVNGQAVGPAKKK